MTEGRGGNADRDRPGSLSQDEVERRLGGGAGLLGLSSTRVRARTTRGGLLRDTSTILAGAVLMVVVAQLWASAGPGGSSATATPPDDSGIAIGSFGVRPTIPPLDTLGPVVNPRTGIGASPTPVVFKTLPPATPRPTHKPKPTPKPTPHASPTPAPPVAAFDCTPSAGLVLTCDSTSIGASSWTWSWGDGKPDGTGEHAVHTYVSDPGPGGATVTLSVTGPGGTDSEVRSFVLIP